MGIPANVSYRPRDHKPKAPTDQIHLFVSSGVSEAASSRADGTSVGETEMVFLEPDGETVLLEPAWYWDQRSA